MWKFLIFISSFIATTYGVNVTCISKVHYSNKTNTFLCNSINITTIKEVNEPIIVSNVPLNAVDKVTKTLSFVNLPMSGINYNFSYIPSNIFAYFPSASQAIFTNVNLNNLVTDAFVNCSNLKYVTVKYNNFATIQSAFAQSCANLTNVVMSYNRITKVEAEALKNLKKLQILTLSHNRIKCIPANLFNETPKIANIDLSYNQIAAIDANLFKGLEKLTQADFQNNLILALPSFDLTNSSSVLSLNFNYNLIDAISPDLLKNIASRKPANKIGSAVSNFATTMLHFQFCDGCVAYTLTKSVTISTASGPALSSILGSFHQELKECYSNFKSMGEINTSCN